MDEDQPDLFPEHQPPPHHHVSWADVWGAPPESTAPDSGSNALIVRPEPDDDASDPDLEVSLPAPAFDVPQSEPAEPEELAAEEEAEAPPANIEEESAPPEAVASASPIPAPIDLFAEKPDVTFRQFLGMENRDLATSNERGPGYALPDVWTFSSGRRAAGGRRGH